MKIEINCSQELLEKSKYCGTEIGNGAGIKTNCWIALAVQEVFPNATVRKSDVRIWLGKDGNLCLHLDLPKLAQNMIKLFDACAIFIECVEQAATKRLRTLTPFTFEIELTEEQEKVLLENISLPDLTECFSKSKHLTLL